MKRYIKSSLITDGINDEIDDELREVIQDYLDTNTNIGNKISLSIRVRRIATDDDIYPYEVYFDYRDNVGGNHPFHGENINFDEICNVIDNFLTDNGFIITSPCLYERYISRCSGEFEE